MNITTTVTWDDLLSAHDDDLQEYRDAYADLADLAAEEYDTDLQTPTGDDDLTALQQQAARYNQAVQEIQKRQHVLETLREKLGDGAFELKMLTGAETLQVEKQLRADIDEDTPISVVQTQRNQLVVDTATVAAPEGVPHEPVEGIDPVKDDIDVDEPIERTPVPSRLPNALTMALFEQIERFNNAGATDFRPAGCGGETAASPAGSSPAPTTSGGVSTPSELSADAAPDGSTDTSGE